MHACMCSHMRAMKQCAIDLAALRLPNPALKPELFRMQSQHHCVQVALHARPLHVPLSQDPGSDRQELRRFVTSFTSAECTGAHASQAWLSSLVLSAGNSIRKTERQVFRGAFEVLLTQPSNCPEFQDGAEVPIQDPLFAAFHAILDWSAMAVVFHAQHRRGRNIRPATPKGQAPHPVYHPFAAHPGPCWHQRRLAKAGPAYLLQATPDVFPCSAA